MLTTRIELRDLLQRLGLRHRPREPVQQEPLRRGREPTADHVENQLVRNELAAVHGSPSPPRRALSCGRPRRARGRRSRGAEGQAHRQHASPASLSRLREDRGTRRADRALAPPPEQASRLRQTLVVPHHEVRLNLHDRVDADADHDEERCPADEEHGRKPARLQTRYTGGSRSPTGNRLPQAGFGS